MSKKSKNQNVYTPKIRTSYKPNKSDLISYGGDMINYTYLPSPLTDDIAVNNISNVEFDYIEDPIYDAEFEDTDK